MDNLFVTRILMLEIRHRIDTPVKITEDIVKSLYFNLLTERYDNIFLIQGEDFVNEMIKLYEEEERYETCAGILKQINNVKKLMKI